MSLILNNDSLLLLIENIIKEVLIEKGYILEDNKNASSNKGGISVIDAYSLNNLENNITYPQILSIFTGSNLNTETILNQIKNLSLNTNFYAIASKGFLNLIPFEKFNNILPNINIITQITDDDLYKLIDRSDLILLPFLTRNTAAKAALSITDSLASNALYYSISRNKKIIAVKSAIDPDSGDCSLLNNLPNNFKNIVREYYNILRKAGVNFINPEELYNESIRILNKSLSKDNSKIENKRQIITVSDLECYLKTNHNKEIHINKNDIVTPAAKDYAVENGIIIIHKY